MKIKIKLHPSSSQEKIIKMSKNSYEVWIREKPIENKANKSLEKFLKKYLKKRVRIISGFKTRNKIIEVEG